MPPDFFLGMSNRAHTTETDLKFGAVIVMALRCDVLDMDTSLARKISGLTNPLMWGYKRRPWGVRCGTSRAYTRSIDTMAVLGMLRNGDWQRRGVDTSCLMEEWDILSLGLDREREDVSATCCIPGCSPTLYTNPDARATRT